MKDDAYESARQKLLTRIADALSKDETAPKTFKEQKEMLDLLSKLEPKDTSDENPVFAEMQAFLEAWRSEAESIEIEDLKRENAQLKERLNATHT